MRRLLLYGPVALAAACLGGGEGPATENTVRPPVPSYDVEGTLFDSLAARVSDGRVANARVSINGRAATTDSMGGFAVADVDSGTATVRVELPSYEPVNMQILNDGNLRLAIGLRRYTPMVTRFAIAGDSAMTTVVDLQGRKTIDRWLASNATVEAAGGPLTLLGLEMRWRAVDDFTWVVVFNAPGIQRVEWDLRDVTGFRFSASCQAPDRCDHLIQRDLSGGNQN
ncbi:MAG: hypothetical protein V3T16_08735 [Gemmatimonadales bacterium]